MSDPSFPPKGYVPTESKVEGVTVYMPAPVVDKSDDDTKIVEFKCPNCGAETAYSISDGSLSCTTCGYYQQPKGRRVGQSATQQEFRLEPKKNYGASLAAAAAAGAAVNKQATQDKTPDPSNLPQAAATTSASQQVSDNGPTTPSTTANDSYNWGADRNALDCNNCGAQILLAPEQLTHTCPFCGSSKVYQHQFANDKVRPGYLIPFKLEKEPAAQALREWLGTTWIVPGDLSGSAGVQRLTGIYVPFWTFTAHCSANWRAEIGRNRQERYYSGGEWKTRTVTDWTWETGRRHDVFRDVMIPGTSKLKPTLIDEFETYHMRDLVEYDPSYIAGFDAQTHDVNRDRAWGDGRRVMQGRIKEDAMRDANRRGDRVRNFTMSNDFADEAWRHILVPVYLTSYLFRDESFSVLVNGQTGECAGERPISLIKKQLVQAISFIPGIIAVILALANFDRLMDTFDGEQQFPLIVLAATFAIVVGGGYLAYRVQVFADKVRSGDFN